MARSVVLFVFVVVDTLTVYKDVKIRAGLEDC